VPHTTNNGYTYCCSQFANWIASKNGYHTSGRSWHDEGCEGFLPLVTYDYGMGGILTLRADTPERADVIIGKGSSEIVLAFGVPYHHAAQFVVDLRWVQSIQRKETTRDTTERISKLSV
jgi:hypothetical protein